MEEFSILELVLLQLGLLLLITCVFFKIMLNSARKRVHRLQEAFEEKTKEVVAERERRRKQLFLNLSEEIELSEKRYAVGTDSVPLEELDINAYQESLAVPLRLAYLRAERDAVELRDTDDYWEFIDKALESALHALSRGSSEQQEEVDQQEQEVVHIEDESLLEKIYALETELDAQKEKALELLENYEILKEEADELEKNKPRVFPSLLSLVNDDESDKFQSLMATLGPQFKDVGLYIPGKDEALSDFELEDDSFEGGESLIGKSSVDSGAQQIDMLNNIIHQQSTEIDELRERLKSNETVEEGQLEEDTSTTNELLNRQLEESNMSIDMLEQELEALRKDYDELLATHSGNDSQEDGGDESDDMFSMEKIGSGTIDHEDIDAFETEEDDEIGLQMERIDSGDEVEEPLYADADADADADAEGSFSDDYQINDDYQIGDDSFREIVMLQQEMLHVEKANVLMEQKYLLLYEDYLGLRQAVS